jgi:hypothetical protein
VKKAVFPETKPQSLRNHFRAGLKTVLDVIKPATLI